MEGLGCQEDWVLTSELERMCRLTRLWVIEEATGFGCAVCHGQIPSWAEEEELTQARGNQLGPRPRFLERRLVLGRLSTSGRNPMLAYSARLE